MLRSVGRGFSPQISKGYAKGGLKPGPTGNPTFRFKLEAKKSIVNFASLLLVFVSFSACADYELVKGKYGKLAVTLNLKTAGSPYFCESSFWASKPKFAAKA